VVLVAVVMAQLQALARLLAKLTLVAVVVVRGFLVARLAARVS
jgi:hypothetical protein